MTTHTTVEAGAGVKPACTFLIRQTRTAYLHGLRFEIPGAGGGWTGGNLAALSRRRSLIRLSSLMAVGIS